MRFSVPEPEQAGDGQPGSLPDLSFDLPPLRGQRFRRVVDDLGCVADLPLAPGTVVVVVVP